MVVNTLLICPIFPSLSCDDVPIQYGTGNSHQNTSIKRLRTSVQQFSVEASHCVFLIRADFKNGCCDFWQNIYFPKEETIKLSHLKFKYPAEMPKDVVSAVQCRECKIEYILETSRERQHKFEVKNQKQTNQISIHIKNNPEHCID